MNKGSRHAVVAATVFDGIAVQHDCAVLIEGTQIAGMMPRRALPAEVPAQILPADLWLAPGFIDIQVNGGGDVLFNDTPTAAGIAAIAAAHRRFGTTALLPTLITDTPAKMRAAAGAVHDATGNPSVLGIHFEGPFLSPEKPGVHDPAKLRVPDTDDLALLTTVQTGVTLVTLAPERVPAEFIAQLAAAGARVSLGHSMATYAQTKAALAQGLTGFTHLFNAMRPLGGRDPGPIAAALEAPGAWFGMIVDGEHVDPAMLRLALRGAAQPVLVTDAMPPVGGKKPGFTLYGEPISVTNGRCTRADGALAGSALSMAAAVRNCVQMLGVPLPKALTYAATAPAEFLGLGKSLGKLAPGFRADLVAFRPDDIAVHETWVAGKA